MIIARNFVSMALCILVLTASFSEALEQKEAERLRKALDQSHKRTDALNEITKLGPDGAVFVPELIQLLRYPNARWEQPLIARTLGSIGSSAAIAVPYIIEIMNEQGCEDEGNYFYPEALSGIGEASLDPLLKWLGNDDGGHCVVASLSKLGKKAIPALVVILQDETTPIEAKKDAIWALAYMGGEAEETLPLLKKLMESDELKIAASGSYKRIQESRESNVESK